MYLCQALQVMVCQNLRINPVRESIPKAALRQETGLQNDAIKV